jgi:hypothetical protein
MFKLSKAKEEKSIAKDKTKLKISIEFNALYLTFGSLPIPIMDLQRRTHLIKQSNIRILLSNKPFLIKDRNNPSWKSNCKTYNKKFRTILRKFVIYLQVVFILSSS